MTVGIANGEEQLAVYLIPRVIIMFSIETSLCAIPINRFDPGLFSRMNVTYRAAWSDDFTDFLVFIPDLHVYFVSPIPWASSVRADYPETKAILDGEWPRPLAFFDVVPIKYRTTGPAAEGVRHLV